jgi:glycerol kinase
MPNKEQQVGLTAHSQKGHIARATLEAACHQTAAILDAMAKDSGRALSSLAVDGGLSNSDLCMQTQADLSGIRVDRPAMRETTSLGAAIAAGLATGVWSSINDLRDINSTNRTLFEPKIGKEERARSRRMWERAVEMCRGWIRDD